MSRIESHLLVDFSQLVTKLNDWNVYLQKYKSGQLPTQALPSERDEPVRWKSSGGNKDKSPTHLGFFASGKMPELPDPVAENKPAKNTALTKGM